MTGEITLRGRVLPIGGLKEKALAAHRAGIRLVILPRENQKDLEEIPKSVAKVLKFAPVQHMDEVLKHALELEETSEFFTRVRAKDPEPAAKPAAATAETPPAGPATQLHEH